MKSVVIVEDDLDTADMLAEMMRIIGFQVFHTAGGHHAIELIATKRPTLILLDQMLPEVSGLEILRLLRLDPRLRFIPVIIISAKGFPADKQEGMEAGATQYLTKPVAFDELKLAIDQAISR